MSGTWRPPDRRFQHPASIPIGYFSDRFCFKAFLTAGDLFCSLTGLLYYLAETPNLIFLGRMLQGVGEAPDLGTCPCALVHSVPC